MWRRRGVGYVLTIDGEHTIKRTIGVAGESGGVLTQGGYKLFGWDESWFLLFLNGLDSNLYRK
jgi:hypothetical protein